MTPYVDPTRVLRLLRTVTEEVAVLEHERSASGDRRSDPLWLRGVKFSFVVASEAAADTAQHLCAGSGWGPPSDNGHAMRLLGEHGVLPPDLASRMSQAVGFRNVLVHDYAPVDDDRVVRRLDDLSHLTGFAREVSAAVHRHSLTAGRPAAWSTAPRAGRSARRVSPGPAGATPPTSPPPARRRARRTRPR